ncbi:MAG: PIN domain-containing protein [Beijerinckiaceae bacterium]
MPGNFFDTNVLLYLASDEPAKADRAETLIADGGMISVQVLNEIANVARRKMEMSWEEIHGFLAILRSLLPVVPVTVETHEVGIALAERYGFATYDAMIAAAAILSDCDTLWSEDLQHGMMLDDRLRIVNPFRPS